MIAESFGRVSLRLEMSAREVETGELAREVLLGGEEGVEAEVYGGVAGVEIGEGGTEGEEGGRGVYCWVGHGCIILTSHYLVDMALYGRVL